MNASLEKLLEALATYKDTTNNPTGSWRYFRPVFADRHAPCMAACPAGNPIRDFLRLAADGNDAAALAAVKEENPLPSICGRVCHHPCATECSRGDAGEPLAPFLVERHLGDSAAANGLRIPAPLPSTGKKAAVVGAGPAGLACAYHLALLGHGVTLFDANEKPGGMLRRGIPAYRLPREALDRDLGFISELKINLVSNKRISGLGELAGFDAIALCIGAHDSRPLGVDGDSAPGVWNGLGFLAKVNAGERPDIGSHAVVIGGGNTAMDCARAALRLGAQASIIYRRGEADMPALPEEISETREEGVAFDFHALPVRIVTEGGRVAGIEFVRTTPGEPGPDGRRLPQPVAGSEFVIEASAIITAVGENPESAWLPGALAARGGVPADSITLCSDKADPAIFCAGDAAADADRTVSNAIGAGKRAAIAMDLYLKKRFISADHILAECSVGEGGTLSMKAYKESASAMPVAKRSETNMAHVGGETREKASRRPAAERLGGFDEVCAGLTEEQVRREAARCLRCGTCTDCGTCLLFCPDMSVLRDGGTRPEFNLEFCKGCGICARECPRAALVMIEEEK